MKNLKKNIKFLWHMWKREYKNTAISFIVLAIFFQVAMPFLSVLVPSYMLKVLESDFGDSKKILLIVAFALGFLVIKVVYGYFSEKITEKIFLVRIAQMKYTLIKLFDLSYEYIISKEGKLSKEKAKEAILSGNEIGPEPFFKGLMNLVINTIIVIIFSVISSKLNPLIAVVILITSSLRLIQDIKNQKWEEHIQNEEKSKAYERHGAQQEMLDIKGGKDVRLYNLNIWFQQKLEKVNNELFNIRIVRYKNKFKSTSISNLSDFIRDGICYIFLISETYKGNIQISDFVLYIGIISTISSYIKNIFDSIVDILKNNIVMDAYRSLIEMDLHENVTATIEEAKGYKIELKNVSYSYEDKKVIENLNLTINEYEKLALVGANGAGKTTLIKLIAGLYTPDEGEVLINGININHISKKEKSKLIALVFQDIRVFANSIGENVSSTIKEKIDEKKLERVLKDAGIYEKIMSLEKSYNTSMTTYIDEDGINLSGGQEQRLMLAKALYKETPILILDEPTSALDPLAEAELYEEYNRFTKDKTSIFISHRLSSTKFCDRVVYLENGKVLQDGSHYDLMKVEGPYKNMFDIQSQYYKEDLSYEG